MKHFFILFVLVKFTSGNDYMIPEYGDLKWFPTKNKKPILIFVKNSKNKSSMMINSLLQHPKSAKILSEYYFKSIDYNSSKIALDIDTISDKPILVFIRPDGNEYARASYQNPNIKGLLSDLKKHLNQDIDYGTVMTGLYHHYGALLESDRPKDVLTGVERHISRNDRFFRENQVLVLGLKARAYVKTHKIKSAKSTYLKILEQCKFDSSFGLYLQEYLDILMKNEGGKKVFAELNRYLKDKPLWHSPAKTYAIFAIKLKQNLIEATQLLKDKGLTIKPNVETVYLLSRIYLQLGECAKIKKLIKTSKLHEFTAESIESNYFKECKRKKPYPNH